MSEAKYCYKCHCNGNGDHLMEFYPGRSYFGTYECTYCGYTVDKKSSGDNGEKYA